MRRLWFVMAAALVALFGSLPAPALTLLDLTDSPSQAGTPYALTFVAQSTSTLLSVSGFDVSDFHAVETNAVIASGSTANLLGQTWIYTPAAIGASALQAHDDTMPSVNRLYLQGTGLGSYDTFSQKVDTVVGGAYTYRFSLSNLGSGGAFRVTVADSASVPEPGTWLLMLVGFGLIGAALRHKQWVFVRYL